MRRLIFLALIFASLTGVSQGRRELQYYSSLMETIPFISIKFVYAGMSFDKADYWYSLNASPFENVYDVGKEDIYPVVVLKDLKLKPDSNFLRIYYREGNGFKQFSDTLFFIHPKLTVKDVKQNSTSIGLTNGYYLIHKDQEVSIDYSASFGNLTSYKKPIYKDTGAENITQINYKLSNGTPKQAAASGILKISSFKPGLNQLVIQYKTEVSMNYPQDTISFFYTWFELDPLFNSAGEIWKMDTLIRLNGYPAGGWFTGNGIEGNSLYFNPAKAVAGNIILTYHFPYKGKDLTTTGTVSVLSYDFSLTGAQSVCANSSNVDYTISNYNSGFDYTWTITGGSLVSKNNTTGTLKWDKNAGVGLIKVTASHKISSYKVTKYLSVYKTSNQAYDVPSIFFGDADNRLVISSFTTAYEYQWIPDGLNPVVTKSHFYYFNTAIKTKVTLLVKTEKGCESSATINLPNKASSAGAAPGGGQAAATVKNPGSVIFPNPAKDQIFISVRENIGEMMNMSIYDAKSNLMLNRNLNSEKNGEIIRVDVSGFISGVYFVVVEGSAGNLHEKFMVTK
jgi:hypothetical protein